MSKRIIKKAGIKKGLNKKAGSKKRAWARKSKVKSK
jgi:hypothetical protein